MAHSLVVPQMGESITEGIISKLLVKEGTVVTADTPVFELDTDKIRLVG
jgi:pyruvate/2-oxoglutarate dehydrogenase complex dihydrolipoamide acyltransferase (E2) component